MNRFARYNASPKGKARLKKYRVSEKGKASERRYAASEKGKAAKKRWAAKQIARGYCRYHNEVRLSETQCWKCLNRLEEVGACRL